MRNGKKTHIRSKDFDATEMWGTFASTSSPKYIQVALVRAMENILLVPVVSAGYSRALDRYHTSTILTSLAALMIYFDQNPVSLTHNVKF